MISPSRRKWMSSCLVGCICLSWFASSSQAADEDSVDKGKTAPKIQLAILLDTSGSMSGLINQARTQLWKVVNEFTTATRNGQRPLLQVPLYEYGKRNLGQEAGFMRQIVPLTGDLDRVSEELFKLTTGGSAEYCGQVIGKATRELKWSKESRDLKCIFIAGNEPFTQGPVNFRDACHAAANAGVTVSTIYCGPHEEGINTMWLEASKLADGSYMNIDADQKVVAIPTPHDKKLSELNAKLNTTYVAYGSTKARDEAVARQTTQDKNAADSSPSSIALRTAFKSSHLYSNAGWDLCDACRLGKVKLEDLKEDQLPEPLRKMSVAERRAYIDGKIKEREAIQQEIQKLSEVRGKYVAEKRKELAAAAQPAALDDALIEATRSQALQKDFKFAK